jgi:hypothetical protein
MDTSDRLTLQRIVMLAVIEFLSNPAADLKAKIGRHRDIPGIE